MNMKTLFAVALSLAALTATPAFAQAPCKATGKTATYLDQILDPTALAEIKKDKDFQKETVSNIVAILKTDKCVNFLLGKKKTKNLATTLIQSKQQSADTKSAVVINKFLSKL